MLIVSSSFSQTQSGKGVVILHDEEVLFGNVEYHQEKELVSVVRGEKQFTYASSQVKLFQLYDEEKSLNRIYQPYLGPSNKRYAYQIQIPAFFEVVILDDVQILRKQKVVLIERVERDEKGSIMAHTIASSPVKAISYDYFVCSDGQYANLIVDFEEQVIFKLDKSYQSALKSFAVEQKLDLDHWEDQYKILSYYQELKSDGLSPKLISKAELSQKSF